MTQSITKSERSKIIKSLEIICASQEKFFLEISELAAIICQTPVSSIFFSGVEFQAFNSIYGWEGGETSLKNFLCSAAANSTSGVCIVKDARTNKNLQNNPLVTGDPGMVFFASIPIIYRESIPLGFICAIDFEPGSLSETQIKGLEVLSHQVLHLISLQMELDDKEKAISLVKAENVFNSKLIARNIFSKKNVAQTAKIQPEQSEYKFKSLVQDGGDLIAIMELDGTYNYVSPTSTSILGISPEEFVGKSAFEFIHSEDLPQLLEDFKSLESQKRVSISPFRFKNSSGEWRWIETIVTNMLDDPAILGVVANSRDVTDKLVIQQELAMSEQRYKAFLESQTNYFIRTDLQGNYTHVNKKFVQEFGWVYGEEPLGQNSLISICEYHHPRVFEVVKFCLDEPGRVFKVELDKPTKTPGEVMTTLWDFICILDSNGDPQEIQCSGIDVTDTIYYEKELRRSNERFELVNQANSEYIYEFYPNTKRLFLSEKFEEIFGIKQLNESENYDLVEQIRHEGDKEKTRQNFEHTVFQTEAAFFTDSYRIQKENGETLWVRDNSVILRDSKNKPLRVIGSVRDITESHYYQQIDRIERELTAHLMGKKYTLGEVVTGFLENLENLFPEMKTSVMEVKGNFVYPVAAPSLPQEYLELISGFPIGENQGSCGTSVFTKSHVFVIDVQHDIRWENYKDLGTRFGFSACWSAPIFNEKGDVVGTFGCYYDSIRAPFKYELYAIERAQRLFNLIFTQYEYLDSIQKNIELFELINQATKDAIYDWDLINDRLIFGESFTFNFGHPVNMEIPMPIKAWEDLLHSEDRKKSISNRLEFLQNIEATKWENEYRFRKSDGSYAFVEDIGTLIRDKDGTPVRMVGVMRDVTAYKGIQQLLDDSTAISKLGGWEMDLSKSAMTWTKTGYEIHDVPLDFHTTLENGIALYRQDYQEIVHRAVSNLIEHNHPIDLEAVLVTPSGSEKWVRVKGNCEFLDGKCVKIFGSIQDIHSKKLDELEIEYQNSLLNSLTEVIGFLFQKENWSEVIDSVFSLIGNTIGVDRIFLFENHIDLLSGNRLSSQKFEWVREGIESQMDNTQLQNIPFDAYLNFSQNLEKKQLFKAKFSEVVEEALLQAMESQKIQSLLVFPVFIEEEFWGFIGFDDCTTERDWKLSEINFLQSFTSNLESSIKRRKDKLSLKSLNLELESRVKELAHSNLELEQFAYVTSHDLQEPLRMITSFLTLLETKYGTQLDDKAKQYIGFAVDGARRMRQLILDLLDYSRSGKSAFEKQLVDLNEIVDQVFHFYKREIEANKGEILYENLPRLQVSNVSIFQVFQNLIENAIKYAQPGVPSIVTINAEEKKSEWLISVKDNGIGIDTEFHEKIFVIFQRLHNREKYKGTGIGLSIVKKQVESWGGKIWVDSTPELGSTFYFTMPK